MAGLGNLGSALITYKGFQEKGFKISAVFSIGTRPVLVGGQTVLNQLVEDGVIVALNFAQAQLAVPDSVKIQNVDLPALLKTLSYHIARTEGPKSRTP